jgi:hypothetical protein
VRHGGARTDDVGTTLAWHAREEKEGGAGLGWKKWAGRASHYRATRKEKGVGAGWVAVRVSAQGARKRKRLFLICRFLV